jgi:hypothetical protein
MSEELQSAETPPTDKDKPKGKKSLGEQITLWVGVVGSLVTISLTIWNAHTKSQIDAREEELRALEIKLKERTTGIEESKEKVDRYKWVLSLFPDLNETDEKKKNFTISLIRLALTRDEAEQLFASLQTSPNKELQSIGQSGSASVQIEPIALLVTQMNASTAEVRKSAVAALERDYNSSPQAITLILRGYDQDKVNGLSPSGIINGLYFLSATDPNAWNQQQVETGKQVISRIEARDPGAQTKAALDAFRSLLQKVPSRP